jgi:hypothetical protein
MTFGVYHMFVTTEIMKMKEEKDKKLSLIINKFKKEIQKEAT